VKLDFLLRGSGFQTVRRAPVGCASSWLEGEEDILGKLYGKIIINHVGSEVFTTVPMKTWDITPCSLVKVN
jgi:hypothetical protein